MTVVRSRSLGFEFEAKDGHIRMCGAPDGRPDPSFARKCAPDISPSILHRFAEFEARRLTKGVRK